MRRKSSQAHFSPALENSANLMLIFFHMKTSGRKVKGTMLVMHLLKKLCAPI